MSKLGEMINAAAGIADVRPHLAGCHAFAFFISTLPALQVCILGEASVAYHHALNITFYQDKARIGLLRSCPTSGAKTASRSER